MAQMGSLSGKSIRGYEFREQLGAGGFGAVYKAYQPSVQREVAVKVVLPEHAGKDDFIAGFEAEARFVAQLEHAHIVPLHDFWRGSRSDLDAGAGAFIVMRLLRGGSLSQLLANGPLKLELGARILDQIASALHIAHRYGIVHRDLKPGNILLDEDQNAYLADFGIAKPIGHADTDAHVVGSLAYIAPEQLQSRPPMPQSDIYSLGFVLYEMLSGIHPFGKVSVSEMISKHLTEPCPYLTIPQLTDLFDINEVIQRATAKNPDDRYADAISMANDFRKAASFTTPADAPDTGTAHVQPDSSQLDLLNTRLDQLYRRLEILVNQHSAAPDPASQAIFQQDISQVKIELQYRSTGLLQAEQHISLTLPPSMRVIPRPTHALISTDTSLSAAKAAILSGQSVTLLGTSGVGKSALAAELAHDEEVRRAFEGRVVWLPMGKTPNTFDLIGQWLTTSFGEEPDALSSLSTLEARRARLYERVAERRFLVVVDDLWKLSDLQEALLDAAFLFTYIVTTRQVEVTASLIWKTVTVNGLDIEERFRLVKTLLNDANVVIDEKSEETRRLLERIGGLPRDLILLVTRLRRVGANVGRLRREIEKLIQSPEEVLSQGYASLKLSVDELSEAARQAFRALTVFPPEPNSFSEAAGEAVCGNVEVLDELLDASLLKLVGGRYAVEPSFVEYAVQYVPFVNQQTSTERFVKHYCADLIETHHTYDTLESEMRNMDSALQLAAADSKFNDMLIDAVIALAPVWDARGMVATAEKHLLAALRTLTETVTSLRRAKIHLSLAALYDKTGDFDASESQAQAGLTALVGQADAPAELVRIQLLRQQGIVHWFRGEYDESYDLWIEALNKALAAQDDLGISRLHNSLGTLMISYKQMPDAAREHFLKSVDAARRADNPMALALALQNLGLLESTEAHDRAEKYLSESIALARGLGNHAQISATVQSMGFLERERGHLDKALVHFDEALHHSRLAHDNESIGWALLQLANAAIEQGDFGRAETALDESFALAHKRGDPFLCDQVAIVVLKLGETRITTRASGTTAKVWSMLLADGLSAGLSEERMAALQDVVDRLNVPTVQSTDAARAAAFLNLGLLELNEYGDSERARKHLVTALETASTANDHALANRVGEELAKLSADSE